MNEQNSPAISDIEDAATARWLARALAPARAHIARTPTPDAVERMRVRVFGEAARKRRRLAA